MSAFCRHLRVACAFDRELSYLCEVNVNSDKKFNVSQHIKSDKHIKGLARYENQINRKQQQLLIATSNISKKSSFNKDLCKAFISVNIPLNKLENPKFKTFLEVYTKNDFPSESTLRKGYVNDIYNETMDKISKIISDKKIMSVSTRPLMYRVVTLQM